MFKLSLLVVFAYIGLGSSSRQEEQGYFQLVPTDIEIVKRISEKSIFKSAGYSSLNEEIDNSPTLKTAWNETLDALPEGTEAQKVLYCYTIESQDLKDRKMEQFYQMFNRRIREWVNKPGTLFEFKNFAMILSALRVSRATTVYRGVSFDQKPIGNVGQYVFTNQFESSSLDLKRSIQFVGSGTLYMIQGTHFIPVLNNSQFPSEQEYLVPPYFVYKIINVTKADSNYHFNVVTLAEYNPIENSVP